MSPALRAGVFATLGALLCMLAAGTAQAFKPYTHVHAASEALMDVLDDGQITVAGRPYNVDPELVDALRFYSSYYNAGVVGPDGFPDLTMGQSIVHPENTGEWLRYLLMKANEAQSSSDYTAAQKRQILAFTRGYLTHAAGDMWAHTLVNEFAREVFPGVSEILTDANKAAIALRHITVEGYIGDATPGYDGNPDRTLVNGDWSDDSTPGIPFDAPKEFVYDTLVRRGNGQPSNDRGPILDFFLDMRATLAAELGQTNPDPLSAALSNYDSIFDRISRVECDCNFGFEGFLGTTCCDGTLECAGDFATDVVECPLAIAAEGFDFAADTAEAFFDGATAAIALALDAVKDAYIAAWIDDIDAGLAEWGEVGLVTTRALFDPQTRRDYQNELCDTNANGPDGESGLRADCEDAVGLFGLVLHEVDPFINEHLLSMVGFPDVVGDARALLQDITDLVATVLDEIFGPALNPINQLKADVEEYVEGLLKDFIKQRFGFDIDEMIAFWDSPSSKMDVTDVSLTLPGGGTVGVEFFREDDHERIDAYMGMEPGHHDGPGGGLGDDDVFDSENFAAYRNAVMMSKLTLLDGAELDRLLGDLVGHEVSYYGDDPQGNIMTTPLPAGSRSYSGNLWLTSIDGDHAWRHDGLPVFTEPGRPSGGNGTFPLWESCILRDSAYRTLFVDWENGSQNFPPLGDDESHDDVNDPLPPSSTLAEGSPVYVDIALNTFVTGSSQLTVVLSDDFFDPEEISVVTEIREQGQAPEPTVVRADGDVFDLSARADGRWFVNMVASDPCRTEAAHDEAYIIDNTAPVVTYSEPSQPEYQTDDFVTISFSSSDGALGSGVASSTTTFDGAPVANDYLIDMFTLDAGVHEIVVTSVDNLGNTSVTPTNFRVRATSASLLANMQRALDEGLVRQGIYNALSAIFRAAVASHDAERPRAEANQLGAAVQVMYAQSGKGFDEETARRFIGYAEDLIHFIEGDQRTISDSDNSDNPLGR